MSEPFLGQISIFGFNFAPRGWATCDGQILPINTNQSLYSLLGTTYGGDGRTSFGLPDLRGRVAFGVGNGANLGVKGGEETHSLTTAEIPAHDHKVYGTNAGNGGVDPSGQLLANPGTLTYNTPDNLTNMRAGTLGNTGQGQGHENMSPFLTLNFCIALQGLFPSRN
jgi:microcystin-dependent protein